VRLGIRWRLVLAIGIPLVVVYAVMLVYLYGEVRQRSRARLADETERRIGMAAGRIDARLLAVARVADAGSGSLEALPDLAPEAIWRLLEAHLVADELVSAVRFSPAEGDVLHVSRGEGSAVRRTLPRGDDAARRPWPVGALRAERSLWTGPFVDASTGGVPVTSYAAPVRRAGGVVGVLSVDVGLDALGRWVAEILPPAEGTRVLLLSREGKILVPRRETAGSDSVFDAARGLGRPDLERLGRRMIAGERGVIVAPGIADSSPRWTAFAPLGSTGGSVAAAVPESVALRFSQTQTRLALAVLVGGLLVILALLSRAARRLTRPVIRLAAAAEELGAGDLSVRVEGIPAVDEIGDLAASFNRMAADLEHHVQALARETAAREAVEAEIRVARRIQTSLLPTRMPVVPGLMIHALNVPARNVAGDFYDYFALDAERFFFLIADVSGKGVPAALFMAMARTVIRQTVTTAADLTAALAAANEILERDNPGSMFVTLFAAVLHVPSGRLRYVNAAHPQPFRIDAAGVVRPFGRVTGTMVGLFPGRRWEEADESLAPGDRLVLFTDGVHEAEAPDGEAFGAERVRAELSLAARLEPRAIGEQLAPRVAEFERGDPHDDVTLLVVRYGA
jgi:sigma-B regulation protein RsbU (phosphoserine phosphatase)